MIDTLLAFCTLIFSSMDPGLVNQLGQCSSFSISTGKSELLRHPRFDLEFVVIEEQLPLEVDFADDDLAFAEIAPSFLPCIQENGDMSEVLLTKLNQSISDFDDVAITMANKVGDLFATGLELVQDQFVNCQTELVIARLEGMVADVPPQNTYWTYYEIFDRWNVVLVDARPVIEPIDRLSNLSTAVTKTKESQISHFWTHTVALNWRGGFRKIVIGLNEADAFCRRISFIEISVPVIRLTAEDGARGKGSNILPYGECWFLGE